MILVFILRGAGLGFSEGTWPLEVPRLESLLDLVSAGCPGHGLVHMMIQSAGTLGFVWEVLRVGFGLVFHY